MEESAAPKLDRFDLVGVTLEKRFEVHSVIAQGGFGVVYQARQINLDRLVAIKVLKAEDASSVSAFRERFLDEAKTMAKLNHPSIAAVYESGISRIPSGIDVAWIALEWLEGQPLSRILEDRRGRGGLGPLQAFALLKPVLEGIASAHEKGIAHRDIKPGNLIYATDGKRAQLRIVDFGIAKIMRPDESAGTGRTRTTGGSAFSTEYASPEQFSGAATGPWTDVHALGLVMTEVLTDQAPGAKAGSEIELMQILTGAERPTPGRSGKNVGPWETVIEKALAIQPAGRWKDAGELLQALADSVADAESASTARRAPAGRDLDTIQRSARTVQRPRALPDAALLPEKRSVDVAARTGSPAGRSMRSLGRAAIVMAFLVLAGAGVFAWKVLPAAKKPPVPQPISSNTPPAPAPLPPAPAPAPLNVPKPPAGKPKPTARSAYASSSRAQTARAARTVPAESRVGPSAPSPPASQERSDPSKENIE